MARSRQGFGLFVPSRSKKKDLTVTHRDPTVDWLGYSTVRIEGTERVVYLDPGRYGILDGYDARDDNVVSIAYDHHYNSYCRL